MNSLDNTLSFKEILEYKADDRYFNTPFLARQKDLILEDLQANILKGSKHKYSIYCLIKFNDSNKKSQKVNKMVNPQMDDQALEAVKNKIQQQLFKGGTLKPIKVCKEFINGQLEEEEDQGKKKKNKKKVLVPGEIRAWGRAKNELSTLDKVDAQIKKLLARKAQIKQVLPNTEMEKLMDLKNKVDELTARDENLRKQIRLKQDQIDYFKRLKDEVAVTLNQREWRNLKQEYDQISESLKEYSQSIDEHTSGLFFVNELAKINQKLQKLQSKKEAFFFFSNSSSAATSKRSISPNTPDGVEQFHSEDLTLKQEIARWLKNIPLTSAKDQMELPPDNNHVGLYLSYQGYQYLFNPKRIGQFINLNDDDIKAFEEGLEKRCQRAFGAVSKPTLDKDLANPSDALVLISTDDEDLISRIAKKEENKEDYQEELFDFFVESTKFKNIRFKAHFGSVAFKIGFRNPEKSNDAPRGWFGFKDGISNPRYFTSRDFEKQNGYKPDPPARLNTVLRRNELSPKPYACGSFVVLLKFRLFPSRFKGKIKKLSEKLGYEDYQGYAASNVIGRHKDGTPLVDPFTYPSRQKENYNDFDYKSDPEGLQCPMNSHVRKANPRSEADWRDRQIVRRGMVYGPLNLSKKDKDSPERGLLFVSYQSRLQHFEDIVNKGIYGYNFNRINVGKDALFTEKGEYKKGQKYVDASGRKVNAYTGENKQLVQFKGGQYFFASSISFIKTNLENCM